MCPTGIFSASQSVNVVFGSAVRRSADKSVYDFSIFNIFSILAVCLMVYFQCRIMLVNGGKKISALFLAACVVTSYSVLWALNFRPDTFMYLCLLPGYCVYAAMCGKSAVAFGHVVSVFFPGFHVYAESAFKFNRPWLICAVLAF